MKFRYLSAGLLGGVVAISALSSGCDKITDAQNALCCKDWQPGRSFGPDQDWGVKAELKGPFGKFAQAAADISFAANGLVEDVTVACRNIATDLSTDTAKDLELPTIAGKSGGELATGWCDLAAARLQTAIGSASITVDAQPPRCTASLDAQASCDGSCKVDASCKPGAIEARCDPGKLSGTCDVNCTGSCEGSVQASAACQGSCSASCEGTCEASGGVAVDCEGSCSGNCTGSCEGAAGTNQVTGAHCDGVCKGQCNTKCSMRAGAKVSCKGKCTGRCTGSCKMEASATVKCDAECKGGCSVAYKAPKCEADIKPPSCNVDAKCEASCKASLQAKAECKPGQVRVSGAGLDAAGRAVATIEQNIPALVIAAARREAAIEAALNSLVNTGSEFSVDLATSAPACLVAMTTEVGRALAEVPAALSASIKVTAVVKVDPTKM